MIQDNQDRLFDARLVVEGLSSKAACCVRCQDYFTLIDVYRGYSIITDINNDLIVVEAVKGVVYSYAIPPFDLRFMGIYDNYEAKCYIDYIIRLKESKQVNLFNERI